MVSDVDCSDELLDTSSAAYQKFEAERIQEIKNSKLASAGTIHLGEVTISDLRCVAVPAQTRRRRRRSDDTVLKAEYQYQVEIFYDDETQYQAAVEAAETAIPGTVADSVEAQAVKLVFSIFLAGLALIFA